MKTREATVLAIIGVVIFIVLGIINVFSSIISFQQYGEALGMRFVLFILTGVMQLLGWIFILIFFISFLKNQDNHENM